MAIRDRFDTDEPTRPGMHSEPIRRLRGDTDDPWETLGNLMAEIVVVHQKLHEWNATADSLNSRLGRIEKLLYGSAGSAALMILQYIAQKLGLHILPP